MSIHGGSSHGASSQAGELTSLAGSASAVVPQSQTTCLPGHTSEAIEEYMYIIYIYIYI